jgi:hypothetical protein
VRVSLIYIVIYDSSVYQKNNNLRNIELDVSEYRGNCVREKEREREREREREGERERERQS